MKLLLPCLAASLIAAAAAVHADTRIQIVGQPKVDKIADGVKIEFTVSAATDVAVYVQDAAGRVVRHLAGGVLGKNAPAPLQADSLTQTLVWDGKDNAGEPAAGGPFKIRIAAGLDPQFDSFLLHNPDSSGPIKMAAVGPGGSLYVFHSDVPGNGAQGGLKVKVYDRQLKHHKALTPFPADLPAERLKALGVFQAADGELVPRVHNYQLFSFYPDNVQVRSRDIPEMSAPAVDSTGRVYWTVAGPSIAAVDADGGIPGESFLGPKLLADMKGLRLAGGLAQYWPERVSLAVSSDDKFIYVSGLATASASVPCVFRVDAATRSQIEPFLGKVDQPGNENDLLAGPRGLTVAKGLIYVADFVGDRVVVFKESDRSLVGQIKVKAPESVGVDPQSGAVYVGCLLEKTIEIIKFAGLDGKEVARLSLPAFRRYGTARLVVDATDRPVRVWLPEMVFTWPLKLIEDEGDKLVDKGDPRGKDLGIDSHRDLTVDRVRGEVYVKCSDSRYRRLDDATGQVKDVLDLRRQHPNYNSCGTQLVPGADGHLYTYSTNNVGVRRLDRAGNPLNWPGMESNHIPIDGPRSFQLRHMALPMWTAPEELLLVCPGDWQTKNPKDSGRLYAINAIGVDGKPRRTVIWQCHNNAVVRTDAKGNVYVADLVKPEGRSYPEFFDGKLPEPPAKLVGGELYWNSHMYGSVIKFPPSGGAIWWDKDMKPTSSAMGEPPAELRDKPKVAFRAHDGYAPLGTGYVQGAEWIRFGYSPYASRIVGHTSHCSCEGNGFDVDPFGRVFYPNLGQFRIEVVDTNNNPIVNFGKYGNQDSGGPGAKVSKPAIPLAWPQYVAVSDRFAYIADLINRRIVRVSLNSQAEQTVAVP